MGTPRKPRILKCRGESHNIAEWGRIRRINPATIAARLDQQGLSVEMALGFVPMRKRATPTKLTPAAIEEIQTSTMKQRDLAAKHGISEGYCSLIRAGKFLADRVP